jgi:hypothetical protein
MKTELQEMTETEMKDKFMRTISRATKDPVIGPYVTAVDSPYQIVVCTEAGSWFYSMYIPIAFKPKFGLVTLSPEWNRTRTTRDNLLIFLGGGVMNPGGIQSMIDRGLYKVGEVRVWAP